MNGAMRCTYNSPIKEDARDPAGSVTRNRISLIFPVALSSELPCESGFNYNADAEVALARQIMKRMKPVGEAQLKLPLRFPQIEAARQRQQRSLLHDFFGFRKPVTPAPLKPDS
jgi:hypothetical protein